jgi:type I restriction enzyme M protein
MKALSKYLEKFDEKYSNLKNIDNDWYKSEMDISSFLKKSAPCLNKNNKPSEEYIRARFVWSMINSGMYQKEYICVEFSIPKGNGGKSIDPDVVIFKNKDWIIAWEDAKRKKSFVDIRKNILAIFETKKDNKTVEYAIENQLRPAMSENTSDDRVFGIYFDDELDILVFKKSGNSELRRFYEENESLLDVAESWNTTNRDSLSMLPSQKDFIQNNQSINDLSKLVIDSLDAIDQSLFADLMNSLKRANDSIRPKSEPRSLIVEFLTLKVFDEKNSTKNKTFLEFYIKEDELSTEGLGKSSFRERILNLYSGASREYPKVLGRQRRVFTYDDELRPSDSNDERFLIELIKIFQRRAILKAKNTNFNQIIFNNFGDEKQKSDKGQFFTPIPVVDSIIRILNPRKNEEVLDPCCGICDFPAMAFKYSHRNDKDYPPNASNLYGFDIESSNLKLAELNLVLNGDGGAVLEQMNSLTQKMLEDGTVLKSGEFNTGSYNLKTWKSKNDKNKDLKQFDIVATNPPFGKGRDLSTGKSGKWDIDKQTINMYETYLEKLDQSKDGKRKLPQSMDMGVLFLENSYKILKEGGRMGIVLSNSIASIKEWKNIRKWLIDRMRMVALFDLPANTFGETGVATTTIIAYKPTKQELKEGILKLDYEVFIKEIKNIGYEVKTKKRTVNFEPRFIINEETFENTGKLDEDFSKMKEEFGDFLNRQDEVIKRAFNHE